MWPLSELHFAAYCLSARAEAQHYRDCSGQVHEDSQQKTTLQNMRDKIANYQIKNSNWASLDCRKEQSTNRNREDEN